MIGCLHQGRGAYWRRLLLGLFLLNTDRREGWRLGLNSQDGCIAVKRHRELASACWADCAFARVLILRPEFFAALADIPNRH